MSRWAFFGDSANDEPIFAAFEHSIGVANVADFLGRMEVTPTDHGWERWPRLHRRHEEIASQPLRTRSLCSVLMSMRFLGVIVAGALVTPERSKDSPSSSECDLEVVERLKPKLSPGARGGPHEGGAGFR